MVNHVFNDLEISCLPADLPEFIEVDLSKIEVGHSIHAKDLVLPKGVVLSLHIEQDNPVVAVARVPSVSAEPLSSGAPEAPAAPTAIKVKDKEE